MFEERPWLLISIVIGEAGSPTTGVERRRFERDGVEEARDPLQRK